MSDMAKILIIGGLAMCGLGVLLLIAGKIPGLGKLPGDIMVRRENFTFYFPLATCILLSVLLSILMQVFFRK